MHVLHRQRQSMHPFARGAIIVGIGFCLILPIVTDDLAGRAICLGAGVLMVLAYFNFETLTVIVYRDCLRVGHPVFNSKIPIKDIRRVAVEETSPWTWGGIGVRLRPGSGLGYIARGGSAIRIEAEGRRMAVTFSCDDPDAVVAALGEAGCRAVTHTERAASPSREEPAA